MSECTHDCSTCGLNCPSKAQAQKPKNEFEAPMNSLSKVKKVYGIVSGKGGVGKSLVTSTLAVNARRRGYETAVLDADITGPSIPKAFGLTGGTIQSEHGIEPVVSNGGIRIMSLNMLVEDPTDPVVWRGPVIAGAVKQFWTDVHWGDIDVMFVDMPPGTGDVPLTVFQSLPVDGVVIVSSPQKLVEMIVGKSVKMAKMMAKKVLGLVENMSYFTCPSCSEKHEIFGESQAENLAKRFDIDNVVRLPINPDFARTIDAGAAENLVIPEFESFISKITD